MITNLDATEQKYNVKYTEQGQTAGKKVNIIVLQLNLCKGLGSRAILLGLEQSRIRQKLSCTFFTASIVE